jgi:hypothetical protein
MHIWKMNKKTLQTSVIASTGGRASGAAGVELPNGQARCVAKGKNLWVSSNNVAAA